jgi:hypothetical protein
VKILLQQQQKTIKDTGARVSQEFWKGRKGRNMVTANEYEEPQVDLILFAHNSLLN